jgi:uncharacterized protein YneR
MRITEKEYLTSLEVVKLYKKQIEIETDFNSLECVKQIGKTISSVKMSKRLINIICKMYEISYYNEKDRINFLKKDLSFFNDFDMKVFKRMRDCGKYTQTEMEYILQENNIPYFYN